MVPDDDAAHRLAVIRETIARTARIAGRDADAIELIAVSKTFGADAIAPLIAAGQRSFGENRVAEAQEKWPALLAATPGLHLHLSDNYNRTRRPRPWRCSMSSMASTGYHW